MNVELDREEIYVWAAVDCETFEVIGIEVMLGQSTTDALLFLKKRSIGVTNGRL